MNDNLIGTGLRGGGYTYEWKGVTKNWRCPPETMQRYEEEGRLFYTRKGVARLKRYLDDLPGLSPMDLWLDIFPVNSQAGERMDYPTQKPESLLNLIIASSSRVGDVVLDAFAGSGTTLAVSEKLGRRWIGIDCGKLAIYTIQKRLLNLRHNIGNKGSLLAPHPFTVYNAGLYDFSTLRQLPWEDWRRIALQLFECREDPHALGGVQLDGRRKGDSVLVFNHHRYAGKRIDVEMIQSLHAALGDKVGRKFYVIAPRAVFDFQQDYIDLDSVRYYALRIPYSVINELHRRDFTALRQPTDEAAVNDIVESWGFDFIRPPEVEWEAGLSTPHGQMFSEATLRVSDFRSHACLRKEGVYGGLETLSMLLLDCNYGSKLIDGKPVFELNHAVYGRDLAGQDWEVRLPAGAVGTNVMAVFMDTHGNEARIVIPRTAFGLPSLSTEKPT